MSAAMGLARIRVRGLGLRPQPAHAVDETELLKLDVGWSAGMSLSLIDSARAAQIFVQNLIQGLRAGDLLRTTRPLLAVASLYAVRGTGGLRRYGQLLQQAEQWMAQSEDPHLQALYYMVRGLAAYAQGQWSLSLKLNDQSAALFRDHCTGVTLSVELNAYYALRALGWLGKISESRERRLALLKEAAERQDRFAMTNFRTKVMTLDVLADDDPDLAAFEIEDAIGHWSQKGFHAQHLFALIANLRVDLYRGEGTRARKRICDAWDSYRRSQLHRSCIGRININQMIASSALASWSDRAQRASIVREAKEASDRLEREEIPYATTLARMLRGRLASLHGDREVSTHKYQCVVEEFRMLEMPIHEAAVQWRLGEELADDQGQALMAEAAGKLESLSIRNPSAIIRMVLP